MTAEITAYIAEYIAEIDRQYQTGVATEHTYRSALQQLLTAMLPQFVVSNEPKRTACGAPDLILLRDASLFTKARLKT